MMLVIHTTSDNFNYSEMALIGPPTEYAINEVAANYPMCVITNVFYRC